MASLVYSDFVRFLTERGIFEEYKKAVQDQHGLSVYETLQRYDYDDIINLSLDWASTKLAGGWNIHNKAWHEFRKTRKIPVNTGCKSIW